MAPAERKSPRTVSERERGLVTAVQDVTTNVVKLARNHVELAKAEARHEVKLYGGLASKAAVSIAFALLGFGILNGGVILLTGAIVAEFTTLLGGLVAMAVTSLVLATVYIGVGLGVAKKTMEKMERNEAMRQTKTQMERSAEWVKEIREESSRKLPAPTSPSPTETEKAATRSPD